MKTLILIRHAHRDTTERALDNGLSDKGREQAKSIRRFVESRFDVAELIKEGIWIVSSPKLRCVETLQPMAKSLNRPVDAHPELEEQKDRESQTAFENRIRRFLEEWGQSQVAWTFVCSHGDWLPLATMQLLGFRQDFKKGSWFEVERDDVTCGLKWYIPSFKPFY